MAIAIAIGSAGVGSVINAAPADSLTCYTTARDATYNTPGCGTVRHWVTRASTGTARTYGAWVGKGGTSMVISYVDWRSSGTQVG